MSQTPKQVLAELLTGSQQPNHSRLLHQVLTEQMQQTRNKRTKEVIKYILGASEGNLKHDRSGGSLKFVLWYLNDHVGSELYGYYARVLLQEVIKHRDWDLGFILPHLHDIPDFQQFIDELRRPIDKDEKAKDLIIFTINGWTVAVNFTDKNLNKIGFDAGAQVVISSSHKGVMIMAERGLEIRGLSSKKGWSMCYPNYFYLQKRGEADDVWRLVNRLDQLLFAVDGKQHKGDVPITGLPKELAIIEVGDIVAALNFSQKNHNTMAFQAGVDVLLLSSSRGTFVNAGRDWVVHGMDRNEWKQLHANLWVKKSFGGKNDLWNVLDNLDRWVIPVDEFLKKAPVFVRSHK